MKTRKKRIVSTVVALVGILICQFSHGEEKQGNSPYQSNPKLAELMSDVTMYVSYDGETMKPDIAAGEKGLLNTQPPFVKPESWKQEGEYAPGIIGKALKTGTGAGGYAGYAAEGNITLKSSGAIAFWLKSLVWETAKQENTYFFFSPGGNLFGVGTEGFPLKEENGKMLHPDRLIAWARLSSKDMVGVSVYCENFKEEEWYLIVVNWAWPDLSLSVNGEPFQTKSLPGLPEWKDSCEAFFLGAGNGAPTLMDEVMVFNRPLDDSEAKLIHDTVKDWAEKNPADSVTSGK